MRVNEMVMAMANIQRALRVYRLFMVVHVVIFNVSQAASQHRLYVKCGQINGGSGLDRNALSFYW